MYNALTLWRVQKNWFSYFSTKTYVVVNQKNRLSSFENAKHHWAIAYAILICVDSDEPLQPPFKLRNSKWCSVNSLTLIEYSSDYQRLWSDCAYAQADLRLCWSHKPHCWKSHATAHMLCLLKEPSQWDGSFEHPKHMLKLMGKKIFKFYQGSKILHSSARIYRCLRLQGKWKFWYI